MWSIRDTERWWCLADGFDLWGAGEREKGIVASVESVSTSPPSSSYKKGIARRCGVRRGFSAAAGWDRKEAVGPRSAAPWPSPSRTVECKAGMEAAEARGGGASVPWALGGPAGAPRWETRSRGPCGEAGASGYQG